MGWSRNSVPLDPGLVRLWFGSFLRLGYALFLILLASTATLTKMKMLLAGMDGDGVGTDVAVLDPMGLV